jgi:hypothetical protein
MFNLFKRKPTASDIGKLGNAVKRKRERSRYKAFHDRMAERVGTNIEWAD